MIKQLAARQTQTRSVDSEIERRKSIPPSITANAGGMPKGKAVIVTLEKIYFRRFGFDCIAARKSVQSSAQSEHDLPFFQWYLCSPSYKRKWKTLLIGYWDGTFFMGVAVYTFPSQHAIRQKAEVGKTPIKAGWLHNLNAEVIIGWRIVWVVCLESAGDSAGDGRAMPIVRWMAHGNPHHGKCPKIKGREKEVNCGLLTENESVCRKDKDPSAFGEASAQPVFRPS